MDKKTPLYDTHVKLGGKMVSFAGWLLPVQYSGIRQEHMAVREKCGLFDVSHMGEMSLTGPRALESLNYLLTNDFTDLEPGYARYSPMCNEQGGVVDDLIVYMKAPNDYFIVVNAANREKDAAFMKSHLQEGAVLEDISDDYAQLALQGPKAETILRRLMKQEQIPSGYYTVNFTAQAGTVPAIVSRTGYTGEDGFEFYISPSDAVTLWDMLLQAGEADGLIPCGLGARDTLRLEAGMPLYGHEMNDTISPRETSLGMFVKMKKEDFVGRDALLAKGKPSVKRCGLIVTGRGIVREDQMVYQGAVPVGRTTSGTFCPYLGRSAAMAILPKETAEPGTKLTVDVRGHMVEVETVKLPFYHRESQA